MNKTMQIGCLLFSGLFALVACSDDREKSNNAQVAPTAQTPAAPAAPAPAAPAPAAPAPAAPTAAAPTAAASAPTAAASAPTAAASAPAAPASGGMDEAAIESYLKTQGCMKCHAIAKEKKGPSFKKVAAKYKGKPDGETKVIKNITEGPKFKLEDGTEEEHKVIDTKNPDELKAISKWILSR